jgi:His/Glu/Gln/Arg/opine family amino acid ABC transporter permease subunit
MSFGRHLDTILYSMNWELFAWGDAGWGDELVRGLGITLALALISFGAGLVLGTLFGLGERGKGRVLPRLLSLYAMLLRALPELLVILTVFFGIGPLLATAWAATGLPGSLRLSPFWAGVIAIALVIGAYVSEVVKGAVGAVPSGVIEAGRALGLSPALVMRKITLPLALRHAWPGLTNLWMVVIKITPLVSAIQVEDFIRAAGTAGQNTKHYFVFYGAVLVVYLAISGVSMLLQSYGQTRLFRHIGRTAS